MLRILTLHITTLLVSLLVAISSGYAEPFTFVSMADSRGVNNGVNDDVLSSIVGLVVQEDADFVLFPGDLVNGSTNGVTLASQLNHWRDIMVPVYSSDMYGAKVYAGPGNHEIRNSGSEGVWQSIFNDLPSNGPAGETYMTYSFDYLNSHFVMLNTDRAGSQHTVNYDWLANDLAGTTADHIFVFGHEPAYPVGPHLGSSLDAYPDQRDAFWQLLIDHDVDIYFAGHEHLYDHIEVEGVHQVISGTCGAPIHSGYGGDFYHYVLITVDGLDVSVKVFDDNWEMRDSFEFTQSECSDGIDNDGDGYIDFQDDPGCGDALDTIEDPQCQDGVNNDLGQDPTPGLIDFDGGQSIWGACTGQPGGCPSNVSDPEGDGVANPDPQCVGKPWKDRERKSSSYFCGLGAELALLLPPLMWPSRRGRPRS
jgi:hypothetical protein